jgi:hypothetical protein
MIKKFKFSITDNTTYEGQDALDFYSKALLEGGSRATFRPVVGVKSKVKLPRYDAGEVIKEAGCAWSPSGEGVLDQKPMEVCSKDIQLELCETTFENNFLSELLRKGHNTGQVAPADFISYMLDQVGKKVKNDLEIATWQGDSSSESYPFSICDGLLVQFDEDADIITPTPAVSISISNVIAEMNKVYNAIPKTILNSPELTMYVSTDVYRMYLQALANASSEAYYNADRGEVNFLGVKVYNATGMPNATIVAAESTNLVLLTDLVSDEESLEVLPQAKVTGTRTVRVAGGFKFGVNYLVSDEIVWYSGQLGS